jgi:hypothetical protein
MKNVSYDPQKIGNRIGNLILTHKSPSSKGEKIVDWSVQVHHWKDPFEGYKIFPLHVPNMFDLRKI